MNNNDSDFYLRYNCTTLTNQN